MPVPVVPVQAGQQQGGPPGHQARQRQKKDARHPAQVRNGKGQRRISCSCQDEVSADGAQHGSFKNTIAGQ